MAWERSKDLFTLKVNVPPNGDALVCIPTTDALSIRIDGQSVEQAGMTINNSATTNPALRVGSGNWTLTAAKS